MPIAREITSDDAVVSDQEAIRSGIVWLRGAGGPAFLSACSLLGSRPALKGGGGGGGAWHGRLPVFPSGSCWMLCVFYLVRLCWGRLRSRFFFSCAYGRYFDC